MSRTYTNDIHAGHPARVAAGAIDRATSDQGMTDNLIEKIEDFARENPLSFGLYALGIGFVLGWRLKPW